MILTHSGDGNTSNNSGYDSTRINIAVSNTYYRDADGDGYGNPSNSTQAYSQPSGYVSNNSDCDDSRSNVHPGASEICDGRDNDCDGQVDEGVGNTYYRDYDGDGYGNPSNSTVACSQPSGYVSNSSDCDDSRSSVHPGATEICDGIDNDCDGQIDEGVGNTYYHDADGDGYGNPSDSTVACSAPQDYVLDHSDCDDTRSSIHPGATEIINGLDDNCNGQVDEGGNTYYRDYDGDGYGNSSDSTVAVSPPPGYVSNSSDCDDNRSNVHPGATEICDGIDNDCDGQIDEGVGNTYYHDADGDGYGNPSDSTVACSAPQDYVSDHSDCDDTRSSIHPGATEIINGLDDNCNGQIDESGNTYYRDYDGDGYGNSSDSTVAVSPPPGYVSNSSDCDDSRSSVHPGATEIINGRDDNCNGQVDEGGNTYYRDADGDGYGNPNNSKQAASKPSGYVSDNSDCDDSDANIHPGAAESCNNNKDDDCDGQIDEGCSKNIVPIINYLLK